MPRRNRLHSAQEWEELGSKIKAARLKAGMTQVELATRFGRAHSLIAKIETGTRQITALELRDLGEALGIDPGDLLRRG